MKHNHTLCELNAELFDVKIIAMVSNRHIIIIIMIIIIIIISFMLGIYAYIPETNCVPRQYSVAAILLFLFMAHTYCYYYYYYYYYYDDCCCCYYYYYYYYYYLALWRVFSIVCQKQTMFIGNTV
jgi:hypothetical protein